MLTEPVRTYLAHPGLADLWTAARHRLERNRLTAAGTIRVTMDAAGADRLGGLLGRPLSAGTVPVRLADLDEALRRSAASAGLLSVVAQLTGSPLTDRRARREAAQADWTAVWATLDARLAEAGLADAPWVTPWIDGLRRAGTLTRIGPTAATSALQDATAALRLLRPVLLDLCGTPTWELAELAGRCTGDAHGLDEGRAAGLLVLRAAAAALGVDVPVTSAQRRSLWAMLGVLTDQVSGTVITWALRPPGSSRWAATMRERADLGLVTHLTVQELRSVGTDAGTGIALAEPGRVLHACENPQVLQAAARAGSPMPLLCFAGNPAAAGWALLDQLVADRAEVRYHGDFDWPGMAIAARVIARGARPWRLAAADYTAAVASLPADGRLDLTGRPGPTPWAPDLAATMTRAGIVVHEEAVLAELLKDLQVKDPSTATG